MADFPSVIESIGGKDNMNGSKDNTVRNGGVHNGESAVESEEEIDEKELEEQVSDLVEIRNKEMLKRNLRIIVRENLVLKSKVKKLEAELKDNTTSEETYSMLFRIDIDGDFDEDQEVPVGDAERVLSNSIVEEVVEEKKKENKNKCWNCEGEHVINDCTEPRDQKAIARKRREFQSKTASSVRYHVDERFSRLLPGLPSEKLRSALRLGKDQVPEYIYKMRAMGYPPGWLQAAKIDSSGIIMYNEKAVKSREAGEEDGEIKEEVDKTKYNMDKLVEWAGFNAPLPEGFTDETMKYRAMSYSAVKTLKKMKDELRPKEQKGYVRRKMEDTSVSKEFKEDGELIVLDSTEDDSVIILDSSLEEEEENGKKDKFEDVSVIVLDSTGCDADIEGIETELTSQGTSTPLKQSFQPPPLESTNPMSTPSCQTSLTSSTSSSIAKTEIGTPIVELHSPFTRLPSQGSFGKEMSEHIVFENLPDYTGKWDQMKGLISKIRKRKIEPDDDGSVEME